MSVIDRMSVYIDISAGFEDTNVLRNIVIESVGTRANPSKDVKSAIRRIFEVSNGREDGTVDVGKALHGGDKFKEMMLNKGIDPCRLSEGLVVGTSLDINDCELLLTHCNHINRKPSEKRATEYFYDIIEGVWDFKHLSGKRLEMSSYAYQILSAQHRVAAMFLAMIAGLQSSWDVNLEFANPIFWAKYDGKDTSDIDRWKIIDSVQSLITEVNSILTDDERKLLKVIKSQIPHYHNGRSSNTGANIEISELLDFKPKLKRFSSILAETGMPAGLKYTSKFVQGLCVNYLCDGITDDFLLQLKDQTSLLSTVRGCLVHEGFGMVGHNNLTYVVAIIEHASRMSIDNYSLVPMHLRPNKAVKKNVYIFSEYPADIA